MAIPKEYLGYFAAELATRLEKSGKVKIADKAAATERVQQVLLDDMAKDDKLNQEVRQYLEQYQERIRRDAISYQEMYKLVKRELQKKYKITTVNRPEPGEGRLGRDKVIELSHQMVKSLAAAKPQVELLDETNEVRLEIVRQMQELLREENRMDQMVRQKIQSQKREIAEGSAEWDILFRKYYSEELRKLGVV
jgi:hypothetical protein